MPDPPGPDSTRRFYDDLADTYDLIYADWEHAMTRQAATLDTLMRSETGEGALRVLDCACGIGTQLIGLALLGHDMAGTDLSPAAVARADQECRARGLSADLRAADMRDLPHADAAFDAVICADNSLTHLLTDDAVQQAMSEMRRVIRPVGSSSSPHATTTPSSRRVPRRRRSSARKPTTCAS